MKKWEKRLLFMFSGIFFLGIAIAGCGQKHPDQMQEHYTIGVVTKSKDSEYWMSVCSGMEKAVQNRDAEVEVVILSPDSETDEKIQKKMIEDLIKMQVDALAVSPVDSYENQGYITKAEEEGIPVYSYDTPVCDCQIPYIGIDNEKAGYALAEVMAQYMNYKGKIAVIGGSMRQACHRQRIEGFQACMESYPDIQIETVKSGYSNLRVSEKEMEQIQRDYPDLNGIMTTSAVTALGIAEATKGTGIVIASMDEQEDAVRAVEDGRILALGAQSGYQIGYETIGYILDDLEGKELEQEKILDIEILTSDNIPK